MHPTRTPHMKEAASKGARGRFNPVRYFRNRATFSKLRRSLRAHHFISSPAVSVGTVYSENGASEGDVKVSISKGFQNQVVSISDGKKVDEIMHIKHPSALSKVWSFIKSLHKYAILGGGTCAIWLAAGGTSKLDTVSRLLDGAIMGTIVTATIAMVFKIRSVISPSSNPDLYNFVKKGSERAISALVQHLVDMRNDQH